MKKYITSELPFPLLLSYACYKAAILFLFLIFFFFDFNEVESLLIYPSFVCFFIFDSEDHFGTSKLFSSIRQKHNYLIIPSIAIVIGLFIYHQSISNIQILANETLDKVEFQLLNTKENRQKMLAMKERNPSFILIDISYGESKPSQHIISGEKLFRRLEACESRPACELFSMKKDEFIQKIVKNNSSDPFERDISRIVN